MSTPPTFRPRVEPLESRDLLASIQAYTALGNLYVLGTSASEFIGVTQINNQLAVINSSISVNGKNVASVDPSTVAKVIVFGNGGNDFINLATLTEDADIYTGGGDDFVRCGTGNQIVHNNGGFDTIFHPYATDKPFVDGEAVSDLRQGYAPVCQTVAALAAAVQQGHDFGADIRYLGNHLYEVKLHSKLPTQKVYFDGWTTSYDPVTTGSEFWPVLMQRARLQALGLNPTQEYTRSEWDAWNKKTNSRLYSIGEAIADFTGYAPSFRGIGSATPQSLQASLAHGDVVVAQSNTGAYVSADGVIGNHAYAVLGVHQDGGVWKVRLFNPWGTDRENNKTNDGANDGVVTLTWTQFTNVANFKGYYVGVKK